jgi:branched-chain amino acid transport system permease protein
MDDRQMVGALGINLTRYVIFCFFLGAFLAGVGGVLGSPILGIYPGLDVKVLVFALIVVIVGGVGSVEGAFVGSLIIGLVDTFGRMLFPGLALFSIYFALVVILVFRPTGILGKAK